MTLPAMLAICDLHLHYDKGRVHALKGVSFEAHAGERIAIIGPSGSGKSSLLRVLSGLLLPTQGQVQACGHTLDAATPPRRAFYKEVGLLFQDYGLVPQLDPVKNVLCGALWRYASAGALARFAPADRAAATGWLRTLGLGDRLHLPCKRLSGGEQQRVGIARLLMQQPRLLLLDEPVASLDVHWGAGALEALQGVHGGETVAIAILHDLQVVEQWATRVLLIKGGELCFDGDPSTGCALLRQGQAPGQEEGPGDVARATSPGPSSWPGAPGRLERARFYVVGVLGLLALYAWSFQGLDLGSSKIFGSLGKAAGFVGRLMPPDLTVVPTILGALGETIQMAVWGTTFASLFGLPLAVGAAANISPWWVRAPMRLALNFMRTIPSLIWGLFFVAIVGLGPLPGVLALTCYATGYLGKFYYEAIESIDPAPLLALRTTGASRLHRFRYGVFPQVLPLLLSYTLYMFEYNVRAASVLGVVGAGGIGFYLYSYLNNFTYPKASMALLWMLLLVTVIDAASSRIRQKLTS